MTIPQLPAYRMPTATEFPSSRASWEAQAPRAALLIHDMQDYFLNFFDAQQSPITELLQNIVVLKACCQSLGIPVFYTAQIVEQSEEDRGLLTDVWGPGLSAHPGQEAIAEVLMPSGGDRVLTKWRYSAFQRTQLQTLLQQEGRDQLIICGVYGHIGCLATACDAFMNDIQPFLVGDAIADFSVDYHHMAMNYVAQRCGITLPNQTVIEMLSNSVSANHTGLNSAEMPLSELLSPVSVTQVLRQQLGELLQLPPLQVSTEENLLDSGLDSIRLMSLVEDWRRKGAEVSFADLAEQPTISAWSQLLSRK
ncbi:isochorismatase family protein [Synechococcus sp. PCC 7335]|uniref:isochorismatase family protein n=1 Tax=Synechococcus sp. (strain ATCC 29403 / PCC 7335) TaxID=91464 RepID=UPI00017ED204|nr:isochorismatase family protein [Synechococcus sp. PCC 7335]EDX85968.1 isochorismatase family protein [Synechococcus sp. PCC 7335]